MEKYATISDNTCSLRNDDTGEVLRNPDNPNDVNSTEIKWTNKNWHRAETKWNTVYEAKPHANVSYVHYFQVGIVHANTSLKYISGKGQLFRTLYLYLSF